MKTTLRHRFTPFRLAIIKRTRNNKHWQRCGEKGTLVHCWQEGKLAQQLGNQNGNSSKELKLKKKKRKELKLGLPYDPAISLLGVYSKDIKTGYPKGICIPMFLIVLFTVIHNILISQDMEQTKCPFMNEKKMWH